jgi:hypothetical protein
MRAKIDLSTSRAIYALRLAIVEPVFANIRVQKGMNRFTYRGQAKVNIQWLLFCLVHNVERIAHYGKKWLEKVLKKAGKASRAASNDLILLFHLVRHVVLTFFVTSLAPDSERPPLANSF